MKFLYYQSSGLTGLGDLQSGLETLCREAVWLGRRPVFPTMAPLAPGHNFHVKTHFPVRKYIDTERIEVRCFVYENARPLEISFPAALWERIQELNIPQHEILEIDAGSPITAAQNQRFRLIVRRMGRGVSYRLQRGALLAEAFSQGPTPACDLLREKEKEVLRVVLHPSRRVRERAQEIIRRLPPGYCAIHVRRGDQLAIPAFRTSTAPAAVLLALDRAGIAADAPVYLMTDERSRRWLRSIRKRRPILHYTDFPRLKALITPPPPHHGKIDNYFLFAVEEEILRHAAKMMRLQKHVFLPHLPDQSGLPRHRVMRLYHPEELSVSISRIRWRRLIDYWLFPSPLPKRRKFLRKVVMYFLRAVIRYSALRLFRPKILRRFRDKRKALGLP